MLNLTTMSEEALERTCERLLLAEDYTVHATSQRLPSGTIDAIVSPPRSQEQWVVEVRRSRDIAALRRKASDLIALRKRFGAVHSVLITPHILPEGVVQIFASELSCDLWDGRKLDELLVKHAEIKIQVVQLLETQDRLVSPNMPIPPVPPSPSDPSKDLAKRLQDLPSGRGHWRDYELLCVEIFEFVFRPHIRAARPDYRRSEDGLLSPLQAMLPIWFTRSGTIAACDEM